MLKKLQLENFKSWAKIRNMRLAPITGLFGTNSSGKSGILKLLLMLKQTAESSDYSQVLNFGSEDSLVSLGTFEDIIHQRKKMSALRCEINWETDRPFKVALPMDGKEAFLEGSEMGFSCDISCTKTDKLRVNSFRYIIGKEEIQVEHVPRTIDKYKLTSKSKRIRFVPIDSKTKRLTRPERCYVFPFQLGAHYQNVTKMWDLEFELENMLRRICYLGPLREKPKPQYTWAGESPYDVGQRGEKAITAILATRRAFSKKRKKSEWTPEMFIAYWLRELGLVYDFHLKKIKAGSNLYEVWLRKHKNSTLVRITDVGFGVSQILPVLVLCYYASRGSIVILEQPEIHLHPSAQSGLADVLIDAVKRQGIQIIVESHSEHLLRRLQRRIAEEKLQSSETALYFCDVVKGVSKLKPLKIDSFGNICNWPKDFFGDSFGEIAASAKASIKRKLEK